MLVWVQTMTTEQMDAIDDAWNARGRKERIKDRLHGRTSPWGEPHRFVAGDRKVPRSSVLPTWLIPLVLGMGLGWCIAVVSEVLP